VSQQPHSHEIWESPQAEGIRAGHGGAHINSSKPLSSAQSRRQRKVLLAYCSKGKAAYRRRLRQLILSRQAGLQQGEIQRTPLGVAHDRLQATSQRNPNPTLHRWWLPPPPDGSAVCNVG